MIPLVAANGSALPVAVDLGLLDPVDDLLPYDFMPTGSECAESTGTSECCEDTQETGGVWDKRVTCGFECGLGAVLDITAESHDTRPGVPDVWGEADCGGAHADCTRAELKCTGTSNGVAQEFDEGGSCWATSNDAWASDTTLVCSATVPNPPCNPAEEGCGSTPCSYEYVIYPEGKATGFTLCQVTDEYGNSYYYLCIYVAGIPVCVLVGVYPPQGPCSNDFCPTLKDLQRLIDGVTSGGVPDPCRLIGVPPLLGEIYSPSNPCDGIEPPSVPDPCAIIRPLIRKLPFVGQMEFPQDPCDGLGPLGQAIHLVGADAWNRNSADKQKILAELGKSFSTIADPLHSTSAHYIQKDGIVFGAVCKGFVCHEVTPRCLTTQEGRRICGIL